MDQNKNSKEPEWNKIMFKWFGELLCTITFLISIALLVIYTIFASNYGDIYAHLIEFSFAFIIDQLKAVLFQPIIWWIFIRRCGYYEISEDPNWDDERIYSYGEGVSLLNNAKKRIKSILEHHKVSYFIYAMVIVFCIVIFTELSFTDNIQGSDLLSNAFRYINFSLLLFFMTEITLRIFWDGSDYLFEPLNLFDMSIVISSFIMNVLNIQARIVGILRVLRLIKVIIEMKKVADERKERQEMIREQKKQGSQMCSYVERVIDLLEKLSKNQDIPKEIKEDIEWAIETISSNKLYKGELTKKLNPNRIDIKAWTNMIKLSPTLIINQSDSETWVVKTLQSK